MFVGVKVDFLRRQPPAIAEEDLTNPNQLFNVRDDFLKYRCALLVYADLPTLNHKPVTDR